MFRVLGLVALVAAGVALAISGGRVGPVDLADVPLPMIAFIAATLVVLLALRRI